MDIRAGDTVKFLDDVGGGVVSRVKGNIVFVEDSDGFEIPVQASNLVLVKSGVEEEHVSTRAEIIEAPKRSNALDNKGKEVAHSTETGILVNEFKPLFFLGFLKCSNPSENLLVDVHVVNDTGYSCAYLISKFRGDGLLDLLYQGVINPGSNILVDTLSTLELDIILQAQLLFFKNGTPFKMINSHTSNIRVNPRRFYQDNSFTSSKYFGWPSLLLPLIKNELAEKLVQLALIANNSSLQATKPREVEKSSKRETTNELVEVDLHVHEIVDNYQQLTKNEIFNIQLDRFHSVMESYKGQKGAKIVFIHGVGNGVLKAEISRQLQKKFPGAYFQDASFREYGYGATLVIIK